MTKENCKCNENCCEENKKNTVFDGIIRGTKQAIEFMRNRDTIKCKKLDKEAKIPVRKYPTDAGMDVFALNDEIIEPGHHKIIRTGVTIDFPDNTVAFVWPKSRANFLIGAGVIDFSYQGEILVKVFNTCMNKLIEIKKHQGIAQIVIVPVLCPVIEEVDEIHQNKTERGETGGIAGNAK